MAITRRTAVKGAAVIAASLGGLGYRQTLASVHAGSGEPVDFEVYSENFAKVVEISEPAEWLSSGHQWAEGPAWDSERQALYFTDVPGNKAYRWSRADGVSLFLDPSGAPADEAVGFREPGANGLRISQSGGLLICNHAKRSVEIMDIATGSRRILADRFNGKRFNSPNDLVEAKDATIIFTDPPYGLEGLNHSPLKEMPVNAVYRLGVKGEVTRLVDDMTFPNGVALSPDENWLYVSQSDPKAPLVRRFAMKGRALERDDAKKPWFDARPFMAPVGGLPDGMAVASSGHVFLAGPGGVLVIDPDGHCLGRIATGRPTANCAFGEDGKTLFITAADRLLRVRTRIEGIGFS